MSGGRGEFPAQCLGKAGVGRDDRDPRPVALRKPLKQFVFFHPGQVAMHP